MSVLLPNAFQQFFDSNGRPAAAGSVWFYIPGTDTLADTWQDPAQTITNTNPVILDAAGRAQIWGTGQYRQVMFDAAGNQLWDGLTSDGSTGP
jgi:hypothetical protein